MRAVDQLKENIRINNERAERLPFNVERAFVNFRLDVMGDQITFGEDYLSLDDARVAVEILAIELGGKVKWEKK